MTSVDDEGSKAITGDVDVGREAGGQEHLAARGRGDCDEGRHDGDDEPDDQPARPTRLATARTSSDGSMGLARWRWNPAASGGGRSPGGPQALSASAGTRVRPTRAS